MAVITSLEERIDIYERHQELPQEAKPEGLPHEVWEMDAQGYQFIPDVTSLTVSCLALRSIIGRLWSPIPRHAIRDVRTVWSGKQKCLTSSGLMFTWDKGAGFGT